VIMVLRFMGPPAGSGRLQNSGVEERA